MVGSALFALGSFPLFGQTVDPRVVGATFVAGSLFFTGAAIGQLRASGAVAFAKFANRMAPALIDGSVGLVLVLKGQLFRALRFTYEGGRIARVEVVSDRARLDALDIAAIESYPDGNSSSP